MVEVPNGNQKSFLTLYHISYITGSVHGAKVTLKRYLKMLDTKRLYHHSTVGLIYSTVQYCTVAKGAPRLPTSSFNNLVAVIEPGRSVRRACTGWNEPQSGTL